MYHEVKNTNTQRKPGPYSEPTNVNTTKKETGNAPIQNTVGVQPHPMKEPAKPRDVRRGHVG